MKNVLVKENVLIVNGDAFVVKNAIQRHNLKLIAGIYSLFFVKRESLKTKSFTKEAIVSFYFKPCCSNECLSFWSLNDLRDQLNFAVSLSKKGMLIHF